LQLVGTICGRLLTYGQPGLSAQVRRKRRPYRLRHLDLA
jgi:hypothetical protein